MHHELILSKNYIKDIAELYYYEVCLSFYHNQVQKAIYKELKALKKPTKEDVIRIIGDDNLITFQCSMCQNRVEDGIMLKDYTIRYRICNDCVKMLHESVLENLTKEKE